MTSCWISISALHYYATYCYLNVLWPVCWHNAVICTSEELHGTMFHSVPFLNTSKLLKQNKTKASFLFLNRAPPVSQPVFLLLTIQVSHLAFRSSTAPGSLFPSWHFTFFGFFSPFSFPFKYLSSVLYTIPFFVLLNSVSSAHPFFP